MEPHAFYGLSCPIVIPCTVLFVASDLGVHSHQLLCAENDSCEEFEGLLRMRKPGISVDFRRTLSEDRLIGKEIGKLINVCHSIGADLNELGECLQPIDIAPFEAASQFPDEQWCDPFIVDVKPWIIRNHQ
jgi:hypothetical protein